MPIRFLPLPGPVGGPCLSKDPYILSQSVSNFGINVDIALEARKKNELLPEKILESLKKSFKRYDLEKIDFSISILGLAFKGKPATDDLRGTMAIPIIRVLKNHFRDGKFFGYDPLVPLENIKKLGLNPLTSIEDCFDNKSIVLIVTNHPEFTNLPLDQLLPSMKKPALLYDLWSNYNPIDLDLKNGFGYISFGNMKNGIYP